MTAPESTPAPQQPEQSAAQTGIMSNTVTLYVDPACPFAWMTSRWLLHAQQVRDVQVRFAPMSLAVLNEGRDLDPDYMELLQKAWGPARVAVRIMNDHGQDAFSAWYTAWGEAFHVGDDKDGPTVAARALEAAGLPAALMETYEKADDQTDAELREAHEKAISLVGQDVGTPVISFGEGTAYFGPVVTPAPRGEAAGRLLDGLRLMASVDGFYELKRTRPDQIDLS